MLLKVAAISRKENDWKQVNWRDSQQGERLREDGRLSIILFAQQTGTDQIKL